MKTILTGALAALTIGAGALASVPASAETHNWHGGYEHRGNEGGAALAAGLAGLAVGAAIAGDHGGYYDRGYGYGYGQPAYYAAPPAYYAGPSYYSYSGRCHAEWRWNRHWRRYTQVRACY